MLSDKLQAGAHSTTFKALLAIIVFSFVLTSVGSYLIPRLNTEPVTIGEYKIQANDWTNQYNRQAQQLHRYGPQAAALLDNPQYVVELKKQVLEQMINNVAFNSAVWDMKVRIGDDQVREVIRQTPAFQKDGSFNNDLYLAAVRNMGMPPEYFGEQLRISIMSESVSRPLLELASTPMPYELNTLASLFAQQRVVNLYTVDSEAIAKDITVNDDEAKAFYDQNHSNFMAPANVRFNYLLLSLEELKNKVEVTNDKLSEFFDLYHDDFNLPEQRRIAHIIIRNSEEDAAERVKQVEEALAAGTPFKQLAAKYSDDAATKNNGGDMGLFKRGDLADNLDQAAFALTKVGDISEKIEDSYGTHFLTLLAIVPAHAPEFSEVKQQVQAAYVNAQARDLFNEQFTTISDLSFENPDSLDTAADAVKLKIKDSGLLSQGDTNATWPLNNEKVQELAFNEEVYTSGINSHVINIDEDNALVLNVYEHHDRSLRDFNDVKKDALAQVRTQKINQKANSILEEAAKSLQQDPNATLPEHVSVQADVTVSMSSSTVAPEFSQAIFALPRGETRAYTIGRNNDKETLAMLQKVEEGDSATLKSLEQILATQYRQYLGMTAQNAIYRQARSLNEIKYNEEAINLVTRSNDLN